VVIHLRTQAAAAATLERQWLAPEAVAPPPLPSLLAAAKTQLDRARSRHPDGGDDDKGNEHETQLRQVRERGVGIQGCGAVSSTKFRASGRVVYNLQLDSLRSHLPPERSKK
jgi:hypothetical protein